MPCKKFYQIKLSVLKITFVISISFFFALSSSAQYVYKIKADSVLITNDSCNAEFNLENRTRNVKGFLYNKGNGRTEFRNGLIKLTDSTYIIGADTLKIAPTSSVSDPTKAFQYLGSNIKAQPIGFDFTNCSQRFALTSGNIEYIAVYVPTPMTITGVKFWMGQQGSYTANNNNYVGLYTISPSTGNLTQVAISANNGSLWASTNQTMISVPFVSTYTVSTPTVLYVAIMWSASATTTAPQISCGNTLTLTNEASADLPNSIKFQAVASGQTSLPSSAAMSGLGKENIRYWVALY